MERLRAPTIGLSTILAAWICSNTHARIESENDQSGQPVWTSDRAETQLPSPVMGTDLRIRPTRLPPTLSPQEWEVADRPAPAATDGPPMGIAAMMRPRFSFAAEWEPLVDGVAIGTTGGSVRVPTYPVFGPPPPFLTLGYDFTQLESPAAFDLPSNIHEFSLGLAWMRRINERWMLRFMLNGSFTTDLNNTGDEAWRLRGGGFAMYRPSDRWSFAVGAIATGRDDIPVLPAIGLIWKPSPRLTVNLMMPRPKISWRIAERANRQHWVYLGAAIDGGDWAYERASGVGDRLEYREWRAVLGWESMPPKPPGSFISLGTKLNAEVGYVFGREFEFRSATPSISIGDALLLRAGVGF
jgi:hypothetical protein